MGDAVKDDDLKKNKGGLKKVTTKAGDGGPSAQDVAYFGEYRRCSSFYGCFESISFECGPNLRLPLQLRFTPITEEIFPRSLLK